MNRKISDQARPGKTFEGLRPEKPPEILLAMPPSVLIHLLPITNEKQGERIDPSYQVLH